MRVCLSVVLLVCVCVPRAEAQRLTWDFWTNETAASMLSEHQYLLAIDGGPFTTPIAVTCDDATVTCVTAPLPGAAGTAHTVDIIAYWATLGLWSPPGGLLSYTVAGTIPPPPGQSPYLGTPAPIPGLIEAENYDLGGEGVAYHDSDSGNNGGSYRTDAVDLQPAVEGGFNVGWTAAGEWLEYSVAVAQSGAYTVNARVASAGPGGVFHLEMDGVAITGPFTIPDTGGWDAWATLTASTSLSQGAHVLRLAFDSPSGVFLGNVNSLHFTSGSPPPVECTYAIVPTSQAVTAAGGPWDVTVSASASTCAWTATSDVSWVTLVSGASGTGNGASGYSVAANVGGQRSGTLTIAGQTFTVLQDAYVAPPSGCVYGGQTYPVGTGLTITDRRQLMASYTTLLQAAGFAVTSPVQVGNGNTYRIQAICVGR